MMKIRLICLFLLYFPLSLIPAEDYHFSHLSMEDGLSSNSVYCMIRDSYGYMWFGTFSGLNRYDGRNNTIFRPRVGNPTVSAVPLYSPCSKTVREISGSVRTEAV